MAIGISCPGCDANLNVADNLVGKTIKCKTCGEMIPVSAPKKIATAKRVVVEDDDEDLAPRAKPARRARNDDDDDFDSPRSKSSAGKSKTPLLIGVIAAGVVLLFGGSGLAYFMMSKSPDVTTPVAQNLLARDKDEAKPPVVDNKKEDKKADTQLEKQEENKKTESVQSIETQQKKGSSNPPPAGTPKSNPPASSSVPAASSSSPPPGQSSEEWNRKMMSGELDEITLNKCKRATVFIDVESKFGGGGSGSGWFGIEKNIVITNAHVIGMKAPNSPPPAKITIYVNSGENGQTPGVVQREIPHQRIKIIAVDRTHDIAILEIIGEKDLPIPFEVKPTAKVKERQGITVFGFPLGYTPGRLTGTKKQPSISVRPSTATALRFDDYGILRNLQIEGGVNQGNSGGPQTDAEGYVIGMTVSGAARGGVLTQVCFSVPTEQINGILAGRIDTVTIETAFNSNGQVHIPVRVSAQDPLKRLKSIGISTWVGEANETIRPPGEVRRGILPNDKDYKEVTLTYDPVQKEAKGTLVLPQLTPGQAYWIQPFYSNAITPKYYLPGRTIALKGPPVDLSPASLQVNLRSGPVRPFTLVRSSAKDTFAEGEGATSEERMKIVSTLKGTENVMAADRNDSQNAAILRLKYDDAEFKIDMGLDEMKMPARTANALKNGIKSIEAFAYVNRSGQIYKSRTNVLAVNDPGFKAIGNAMSTDALGSLQECSIPLPNREVTAGESWKSTGNFILPMGFIERLVGQEDGSPNRPGSPRQRPGGGGDSSGETTQEVARKVFTYTEDVNYIYQGTRTRGGRKEAVIKVDGKVTAGAGRAKDSATGILTGYAFVDISTGVVLDAEVESEFELDTSIQGLKQRTYLLNKYNLTRGGSVK